MRPTLIAGILLVVLGVVVLVSGRFGNQRDVLKVGDITVSASERPAGPAPWVSGLIIAAGAILVVSASRRRRAA
jgi:hypothetical protein